MRKNVTLKIDEKIYKQYRLEMEKKGMIISRQIENFMKQQINF